MQGSCKLLELLNLYRFNIDKSHNFKAYKFDQLEN